MTMLKRAIIAIAKSYSPDMKSVKLLFILPIAMVIQSCSQGNDGTPALDGNSTITIDVAGIDEQDVFEVSSSGVEEKINKASAKLPMVYKSGRERSNDFEIVHLDEFDILTDVQTPNQNAFKGINSISSKIIDGEDGRRATLDSKKAAIPLARNIQYRILMYDASTNVLVTNQVATSGTASTFQLNAGKTYNWYAISINASTVPNINSSGVIVAAGLANKDVLRASGQITPVFGGNNLSILFKRLTALIEVDVNTRGIFGRVDNTTSLNLGFVSSGNFVDATQIGDLDVRSGRFSNLTTAGPITGNQMTVANAQTGDAVKKASFHTINTSTIASGSLRVRFNRLNVKLDDESVRNFSANTLVTLPNALAPVIGTRNILNIRLIESALNVSGKLWARTNLIYDPNPGQVDRFRFRPNNNYAVASLDNEYWVRGASTPTGNPSSVSPCELVYPAGTWTAPTEDYRTTLVNPTRRGLSTINGQTRYTVEWDQVSGTTSNPAYPDNSLVLLFLGIIQTNTNVVDNPGYQFGPNSSNTRAWGDIWLAEYAEGTFSPSARITITRNSDESLNYTNYYTEANARKTTRRVYRCVRKI